MSANPQSPRRQRAIEFARRQMLAGAVTAIAAITGAGCWEEIHYDPSRQVVKSEAESMEAEQEPESRAEEMLSAESAQAEPMIPEPSQLTADELFATPTSPDAPPRPETPGDDGTTTDPLGPPEAHSMTPVDEPAASTAELATPAEQLSIWIAASKWSLAAAMQAKGLPASRTGPVLEAARTAAAVLNIELPPLPGDEQANAAEASIVQSLLEDAGPAFSKGIGKRFGSPAAAAASLAIRSHVWLLSYSLRNPPAAAEAATIRGAAEASELPATLWEPLLTLVDQRAEFVAVRQAIFDMHRGVEAHLKANVGEQP